MFKLSPEPRNGLGRKPFSTDSWAVQMRKSPGLGVIFDELGIFTAPPAAGALRSATVRYSNSRRTRTALGQRALLYTFMGGTDGGFPSALVVDGAGNLFGTSSSGGSTQTACSCGTVFELSPSHEWKLDEDSPLQF